jgi:putative ABC transport system permease protein
MTWLVDPVRRLRSTLPAVLGLAVLIGLTAFLAAGGPRLFDRVSRDSIRDAMSAIPAGDRAITLSRTDSLEGLAPAFGDMALIDQEGQRLFRTMPPELPIPGAAVAIVETPSDRAIAGTSLDAELRLRIMEGSADHIHLVAGRAPTDAVGSVPDPLHSNPGGIGSEALPEFEGEVSKAAADKLGLKVGADVLMASAATLDPLSGGGAIAVKITGIYEPNSATDPYWLADGRVTGYTLRDFSANVTFVQSTFLMAPETYGTLATGRVLHGPTSGGITIPAPALRISWRYALDPTQIEPDEIGSVVAALRHIQTIYPSIPRNPSDVSMTTSLLPRLVALQGPWNTAGALLLVASIGAAGVALASLALVVALTAENRRRVLLIQRERGSSVAQALAGTFVEAVLVAVPAGALGISAAIALIPGPDVSTSLATGGAVIAAGVLFELGTVLGAVLGPPRLPTRARAAV